MPSGLTKRQRAVLRGASRQAIENAFKRLGVHFSQSVWLAVANRYRADCIAALGQDSEPGRSPTHGELSEYIAASAPIHCLDGWAFLGRAMDAHIRGDADVARHLAYYAELRAAISLLAAEGVGIFLKDHFVVTGSGICERVPDEYPTHKMTWLALEHWATISASVSLLAEVVEPAQLALREWLDAFGTAASASAIGSEWLLGWGLDLQEFSRDRDARNMASYRPTKLSGSVPLPVSQSWSVVRELWSAYEPSAPSRFEKVDRFLVRLSLERTYEATTGRKPAANAPDFEQRVGAMLQKLSPAGLTADEWLLFLTRRLEPADPALVTEAAGRAPIDDPRHHVQVIARAALLLRVATGACARLLGVAGVGRPDLAFWWRPVAEERGLWEPGREPGDLTDLWADVQSAMEDIEEWATRLRVGGQEPSIWKWLQDKPGPAVALGAWERVALWGLGL